jgi:hypothetical protein
MRRRAAGAALAGCALAGLGPAAADQVLRADDLRRAGLVRLSEIVALADGWHSAGTEEVGAELRPPGFPFGERETFLVLVDGVPVDVFGLGTTDLNRLGLSIADLDRVEIASRPALVRGRAAPGGTIRLRTRRPERAAELRGRWATGSETGDPGPYRLSRPGTPNVERLGYESSVGLGGRGARGWADAAWRRAHHNASDPDVIARWSARTGEYHGLDRESFTLRLGRESARGDATVAGRWMRWDEGFLPRPWGAEIPAERSLGEVRADVEWRAGGRSTLEGSLVVSSRDLEEAKGGEGTALAWRESHADLDLVATRRAGDLTLSGGARGGWRGVGAPWRLDRKHSLRGTLFARVERRREGGAASLDVAAERADGDAGFAVAAAGACAFRADASLDGAVAVMRIVPEANAPWWLWQERGLTFLEERGIRASAGGSIPAALLAGADVGVSAAGPRRARPRLALFVRTFRDLVLERERFAYDPAAVAFRAPDAFASPERGETAGATLSLASPLPAGARLRGSWTFQGVVGGTTAFRAAARAAPRHLARAEVSTSLRPGFEVALAARARSAGRWTAYEGATAPGGRDVERLPGWVAVDVSWGKWLARRRLHAGIAFRNLFDRPVRTHPIGQETGLTAIAQVEWSP